MHATTWQTPRQLVSRKALPVWKGGSDRREKESVVVCAVCLRLFAPPGLGIAPALHSFAIAICLVGNNSATRRAAM
jgi:hypothetical protein